MKQKEYTIIAFSENKPGVLYRISNLFLKRKINIESLTVSETEKEGIARFTIRVNASSSTIEKIVKQLYRIIELIKVFEVEDKDLIFKEVAFIKVATPNPQIRREVEDLAYLFRAKVAHVGDTFLVIEKTGTETAINSLITLLRPFGIQEFVRSGRIAMKRYKPMPIGIRTLQRSSHAAETIQVSAIKRMELMRQDVKKAVSLAQGTPASATPYHIKKAAITAIKKGYSDKYTPGFGIDALREEIVKKLKRDNHIHANKNQIIVTHGAIEALMATFIALFDPNDEIIILTPDYASHITQVQIVRHGGRPIFVPLDFNKHKQKWELNKERLEGAIGRTTKGILLCNPTNPTGKVYTRNELLYIASLAKKYNLYIIADEIYEYFLYDNNEHISIGSFPDIKDRVISIMGVSKSYCMTGWRIGYICAKEEIAKQIFKIHDSLITCPTAVSQYAALAALSGPKNVVYQFKKEYEKKRKITLSYLNKAPQLKYAIPEGSYYVFVKVPKISNDFDFAAELLQNAKVALVPGSAFGHGGEGFLRISFCREENDLRIGLERFVNYVNKKRR